jgi:hypothetical protein
MAHSDRAEARRLLLQIERGLVAQSSLTALLAKTCIAIAGYRHDLQLVEARLKRTQRVNQAVRTAESRHV